MLHRPSIVTIASVAATGLLASASIASAQTTLTVCASGCQYTSINAAIDAAANGDVIQLANEAYTEGAVIDTDGKAITLLGTVDANGNPTSVLDGNDTHRVINCTSGETSQTVFQNLIVQNGFNSENGLENGGGGVWILHSSSPTFDNCIIQNNVAGPSAGGLKMRNRCNPVFTSCQFLGNFTSTGSGGAISMEERCNPDFTDCVFADNSANKGGGIQCNRVSSPEFIRCTFSGNTSNEGGALLMVQAGGVQFTDCTISGNEGGTQGGGFALFNTVFTLTFTDCVITDNSAGIGGGIRMVNSQPLRMINTRVCGNSSGGTVSATTQIDSNTSFTSDSTECVEASCCSCGTPTFPGDLDCDGDYDAVDVRLAMANFGITECGAPVAGDFDGDGDFDETDVRLGMAQFGITEGSDSVPGDFDGDGDFDQDDWTAGGDELGICRGDINGDGIVNAADLGVLIGFWGNCP